ncbi:hypothetical protein N7468_005254 [Penicillium chermesinum]|uniref:Uncharacterized protein n=1 Tax=Penicillium chermesinum TaxID=63820 RepID=A0A9W9TN72_9EURO|nr:uncharacterized protein N7468_005254 [Penicillium chermesinum]KAJ5232298.1 hypothetical protein N7468_005254 [Penicillium chermesinum]KAJ6171953.1 hypothetical protein N7470_001020 [Penicillium chermesinum]
MMSSKFGHASLTLSVYLLTLSNLSRAWELEIFADVTQQLPPNGNGDVGCAELTTLRRSFELNDVGSCIFTTVQMIPTNSYDAGEQEECILPDYTWSSSDATGC